jgi:hypothetical protein
MDESNDSAGYAGLIDKVRTGAAAQLSTQKDRATDGIGSVVEVVRQGTQHLREDQHETIARYVDDAVSQLERFSDRLKQRNVSELFDDAQQFARRNPGMFIGSAFALGLLGARFLKSSRSRSGHDAEPGTPQSATRDYPSAYVMQNRNIAGSSGKARP